MGSVLCCSGTDANDLDIDNESDYDEDNDL